MKNHKFIYQETINHQKIYLVKCLKTSGEFSTKMWFLQKIQQKICPCCKEVIK